MKKINYVITSLCTLFIVEILIYPKECIEYTLKGISIFFSSVFPSLFPFLALTNLIIEFDGISIYSKYLGDILCKPFRLSKVCSLPLVASFLCGYPFGAKYSAKLYREKNLSHEEFIRLLNIASNPGPIFIIGTIGTSLFKNTAVGYILLFSSLFSCFIMSLLISPLSAYSQNINNSQQPKYVNNYGNKISTSIENAVTTTMTLAGFILVFYIISSIIKNNAVYYIVINKISNLLNCNAYLISGSILGLLEMTNGCFILSNFQTDGLLAYCVISFVINFGGISILTQVYSLIHDLGVNFKKYILLKFLQGLISSLVTLLILSLVKTHPLTTFTKTTSPNNDNEQLFIAIAFFLIFPAAIKFIKRLFDIS